MPRRDPELCSKIRDRVDKWDKYWRINRTEYYVWIDFIMGTQWLEDESKLFERYNKIPLEVNKLGVLYNHIIGDQIQNTPNLQISPDEDVPVEAANVRAALIKNITLNSDTKTIFQRAFGQAVVGGYSAWRIGTEYLHEDSFDQEIKFYGFDDPNRCYWDLSAQHVTKTDGMFCGFRTRMSRKAFRDLYGKDIESQVGTSAITEDATMAFADDDSITIIEDYEKEGKKESIYKLSNGMVINAKQMKMVEKVKVGKKKVLMIDGEPVTVFEEREVVRYTIKQKQIAGDFVLEETDFPTNKSLPIPFLDMRSYYTKSGQQITRSFFKDVKDAQRYLNYLATQSAYIMKISRYDQFMAPRKCVSAADTQQMWRDPSVVNGALVYDETQSGLKPEQLRPAELSQSLIQQYDRTLMDIQTGTGIYNTQLGEMGNETSGTAIEGRNKRGAKNTQIPRTSVDVAVAVSGEIVNEMIPNVYDTERSIVLPMDQSSEQRVDINKPADPYGMQVDNDMTTGRYKIRLKPGVSYEGQKEEALNSFQLVLQADRSGSVFPMIADLYAENLPLDNNMEIRNRLRTMVSPEIIEAGKTGKPLPPKPPQPSPEEIMAQLKQQELQMKMQQAQQQAQQKMQELELKKAELQRKAIETQQDITVQYAKMEAEEREAAAQLQQSLLRYQGEADRIGADLQIQHSNSLVRLLEHSGKVFHEKDMQTKEHAHQAKHKRPIV